MGSDPRISVVMPARNAQSTIACALDSLLTQTCPEWELLVIDDGSTDETAAIVARLARTDSRVRLVAGVGEGAAAARNRGIALARGQWLSFLDADDWIDPAYMAKMLTALADAPEYRIGYCHHVRAMPDGSIMQETPDRLLATDPCNVFARFCGVSINAVVLDRQMIADAGGFDATLATCEDWDLWQRLARAGERWLPVDEPLAFYRATAGSLSRNGTQLLQDGRTVIYRAHAPDSRVNSPQAAYAEGPVGPDTPAVAENYAWFALWTLTIMAVDGARELPLVPELAALSHGPEHGRAISEAMVHALAVGMRKPREHLAECWPQYAAAVDRVMELLANAWSDPVAERRMRYALDDALLRYDDRAATRILGLTVGLHTCAQELPSDVAPDHDVIHARVDRDGHPSSTRFGALGRIERADWAEQVEFPAARGMASGTCLGALARPIPIAQLYAIHDIAAPHQSLRARARRALGQSLHRHSRTRAQALDEAQALLAQQPHRYPSGSHREALARLAIEARAEALSTRTAAVPPLQPRKIRMAAEVAAERRFSLPALKLPAVAEDGAGSPPGERVTTGQFRRYLQWLQDNHYHTLVAPEVEWHVAHGSPFEGRPVWLTFDDGLDDFARNAWPELQRVGMTADVLLATGLAAAEPTEHTGHSGDPASKDIATIARLASEGVFFGSRLASGRAADGLSTAELAQELLRSRALIERWIGWPPVLVADPGNSADDRFARLAAQCGFGLGIGRGEGSVRIGDSPFSVRRSAVRGDDPFEKFVAMMEQMQ